MMYLKKTKRQYQAQPFAKNIKSGSSTKRAAFAKHLVLWRVDLIG
jgi:hypothetical protein